MSYHVMSVYMHAYMYRYTLHITYDMCTPGPRSGFPESLITMSSVNNDNNKINANNIDINNDNNDNSD